MPSVEVTVTTPLDLCMELPSREQDQLRVLPLWTRPLLAGRSFFAFGAAGRFGPCVLAAWTVRRRSNRSVGNFVSSDSFIAFRSKIFSFEACSHANPKFHAQGRPHPRVSAPTNDKGFSHRVELETLPLKLIRECAASFCAPDQRRTAHRLTDRNRSALSVRREARQPLRQRQQ